MSNTKLELKDLNLNYLYFFYLVVKLGNSLRATEYLGVVQSTGSEKIAKLEKDIGLKLFIRSTRGLKPTEEGTMLYNYLNPIFSKDFEKIVGFINGKRHGVSEKAPELLRQDSKELRADTAPVL